MLTPSDGLLLRLLLFLLRLLLRGRKVTGDAVGLHVDAALELGGRFERAREGKGDALPVEGGVELPRDLLVVNLAGERVRLVGAVLPARAGQLLAVLREGADELDGVADHVAGHLPGARDRGRGVAALREGGGGRERQE